MKKKYLSILVIFITLILSLGMIVSKYKKEEGDIFVSNEINTESRNEILDKDINKFFDDLDSLKTSEIDSSNKERIDKKISEEETRESIKENRVDESYKAKKEVTDKNESRNSSTEEKKIEVFKIDKNKILKVMPSSEKVKLAKLFAKLSMNDYAVVLDSIKNDSEIKCITKIDRILSERLEIEDYKVARSIFDKYINLNVIKKTN